MNLSTNNKGDFLMDQDLMKKMFDNPPPKPGFPSKTKIPRRRVSKIPVTREETMEHLEQYLDLIKAEGADEAVIVPAKEIPQDPRVLLKCASPKCPAYGTSGSCPPHCVGDFQTARENLSAYDWAIVYRVNIPDEGLKYITGAESLESMSTDEGRHRFASFCRYCYHMGDTIESTAFYDGHYFAINTHFGPCLWSLCEEFNTCQEIKTGICRFPTIAKPSVEQTFCVDFIKLANSLGWEHYMQGICAFPEDYPEGHTSYQMGLILIE